MKIGTLYSSVVLDRDCRIYTGQSDPVSGKVVLEFKAWDREKGETHTSELFGPLKVRVTLDGDLKTDVDEDYMHNFSMPEYRDERKLFEQTQLVFDGQIRLSVNETREFPFKFYFPEHARPTPQQRKNGIAEEDWDVLPPALKVNFAGIYGAGQTNVEYHVRAEVVVDGIEVDIASRGVSPALKYRPSQPEKRIQYDTRNFEQGFTVTSEDFIPESERPQGFRAKAKALLKDKEPPTYAFDLLWTYLPSSVQPDQPISFKIRLRTLLDRTTAATVPDVTIQEGTVTLLGFCGIRVMPKYESAKESAEVKDLNDITLPLSSINPSGTFSKESNYSKAITTQPVSYIPCSFTMQRLSRYYKVRINLTMMVGSQKIIARREYPVVVMPPSSHQVKSSSEFAHAGPSHTSAEDEQLPAYS